MIYLDNLAEDHKLMQLFKTTHHADRITLVRLLLLQLLKVRLIRLLLQERNEVFRQSAQLFILLLLLPTTHLRRHRSLRSRNLVYRQLRLNLPFRPLNPLRHFRLNLLGHMRNPRIEPSHLAGQFHKHLVQHTVALGDLVKHALLLHLNFLNGEQLGPVHFLTQIFVIPHDYLLHLCELVRPLPHQLLVFLHWRQDQLTQLL